MLAISTSWNWNDKTDVSFWLEVVRKIGFRAVEISYTVSRTQLKKLEDGIKKHSLQVVSIHNFCPIPDDGPSSRHPSNYYRLSALNHAERQKAVEWTKVCVDTARRVGARCVVIHAGTVELQQDPSAIILELLKNGERDSAQFAKVQKEILYLRREKQKPHIDVLKKSLGEVVSYAGKHQVAIGLETRYYPTEIPNFEEIGMFLDLFHLGGLFYWHDVGHAEIQERLGITPHLNFLKAYADRMIGMHIHGMKIVRDHLAPFEGDMDLGKVLPFLKKDTIKVIEARHADDQQLINAFSRLKLYDTDT